MTLGVPSEEAAGAVDVFRTVVDVLEHGVLLVDGDGRVLAANPSAERILGFETSRVCGGSDVPWVFVDEDHNPVAAEDLPCQRSLRTGQEQTGVVLGVERADGSFAWVEFSARPTMSGSLPVAVLSFSDVTGSRAERARLRELADHDTLTGLFNRRHFDDALRQEVKRCRVQGSQAVLLMIDLDGLKDVNDTSGHAAGDALLRDAADRLLGEVRENDVLARYGGDEFALILRDMGAHRGRAVADRLVHTLAQDGEHGLPAPKASIGLCPLDEETSGPTQALATADGALYEAKRAGGGSVELAHAAVEHVRWRPPRSALQVFERLGIEDRIVSMERIVAAARELLDIDLAYSTRHTATEQIFETTDGDAESFGVGVGTAMPLEGTYCHRILAGELPRLMVDLSVVPAAAEMPVTKAADVGAYVSVPITFGSGELYGTLCCASHAARPDLSERDVRYLHLLAGLMGGQIERERLLDEREKWRSQLTGMRALAAAVEARDHYTSDHSEVVLELVTGVANRMGLTDAEIALAEQVGLLHDLGKLAIPDAILHKPGPLDDSEWEVMRGHPEAGARLVAAVPELAHLADGIRAEHERWDGDGYPLGLAGDEIPVASRIAFVCDAYHAMTSDRPYRPALTRDEAIAEIEAGAGSQFCPSAAQALVAEVAVH